MIGQHIVDHIDTNRRNNRAENLRWLTRLENALLNPVTRRRIEIACGSIEAFLENPSAFLDPVATKNFEWMRTVSKEEAAQALQGFRKWAASEKTPVGGKMGEWIYGAEKKAEVAQNAMHDRESLRPNVVQRRWKTPTEFVACPGTVTAEALCQYADNLTFGAVFTRNAYGELHSVTAGLTDGTLSVVSNSAKNPIKQWAVSKVTIENDKFVHESVGSYFTLQGALKKHCDLLDMPFGETVGDLA